MEESYKQRAERLVSEVLAEAGCCTIETNYEAPERAYWFRFVLSCRVHDYRTFWVQLQADDEVTKERVKELIALAESEAVLRDHPFPYPL
jgi:hypothetical protein